MQAELNAPTQFKVSGQLINQNYLPTLNHYVYQLSYLHTLTSTCRSSFKPFVKGWFALLYLEGKIWDFHKFGLCFLFPLGKAEWACFSDKAAKAASQL